MVPVPTWNNSGVLPPSIGDLTSRFDCSVSLDTEDKRYLAHKIAYWNGLWSHTRDEEWKGYLEIDLANQEDKAAKAIIEPDRQGERRSQ